MTEESLDPPSVPTLSEHYTRLDMHKDFRAVFGDDAGRRVLGHIQRMAGLMASLPKLDGMTVAEALLLHEGRRSLALDIMTHISTCERPTERVIYGGRKRRGG